MVTHPERKVGKDEDGSSDTDPDMPELIPVPRVVVPASADAPDTNRSCMPRRLLCQTPGVTTWTRKSRHGALQRAAPAVSNQEAAGRAAPEDASATGPNPSSPFGGLQLPPRLTMNGSTSFGARADALAAALDKMVPSVCPSDLPSAEEVDPGPVVADLDVPVSAECRAATSNDLDAELAGVRQGLDEDTDSESDAADSDAEPGADGAVVANVGGGRRTRAHPAAVPRGAPAVAPASTTVRSAVASARRTANEYTASQEDDDEATETSFGPRFKGLAPEDLTSAKKTWTLHSLANVRCPSASESKLAAASLFDMLGRRQKARAPPTLQPSEDGCSVAADEGQKVSFRKRPAPVVSHQQSVKTTRCDESRPGERVMEECVVGSRKRKAPASERAGLPISFGKRPSRAMCADMGDQACD